MLVLATLVTTVRSSRMAYLILKKGRCGASVSVVIMTLISSVFHNKCISNLVRHFWLLGSAWGDGYEVVTSVSDESDDCHGQPPTPIRGIRGALPIVPSFPRRGWAEYPGTPDETLDPTAPDRVHDDYKSLLRTHK